MKQRIPTLDEYIAESQQILEGQKFNWDARKLAKAWTDNSEDDSITYDPSDPKVSLWVTMANQLNLFNVEAWHDNVDEFSMSGIAPNGVVIGIYSTEDDRDYNNVHIVRVKPEDPVKFKKEIDGISPMDWDADGVDEETIGYAPSKLNVKAITNQVQKTLKKFIQIMK